MSAGANAATSEAMREQVCAAVVEALGDALDCGRVWSAWGVGTMSQDDFSLVSEDSERVAEIADAAIAAMTAPDLPAERDRLKAANAELAAALQSCIDYGTTPGSAWVFKKARAALANHQKEKA